MPENWALENWAPRFFGNLGSNFSENWAPAVIWALREKIGILGSKILGSGGILGSEEKSQIMQTYGAKSSSGFGTYGQLVWVSTWPYSFKVYSNWFKLVGPIQWNLIRNPIPSKNSWAYTQYFPISKTHL